jgi:Rrf2 family protein
LRVSQRLDYTLRGLTALAQRPFGTHVAAGEIADELGLPRRFVEQQFTALARSGLVDCKRGAGGGCSLARPADQVSVAEVVRAVQGAVLDVPRVAGSAVSEMWAEAASSFEDVLEGISLADVAKRQDEADASASAMYYI